MSGLTPQNPSTANTENDSSVHLSRTPRPYSYKEPHTSPSSPAKFAEYLPSPALTPHSSDAERLHERRFIRSPDDSGTEADDEALVFTKALPAPNAKPRKGLKIPLRGTLDDVTPFLTPSQLNEDARTTLQGYFGQEPDDDERCRTEKFTRRRQAELLRRGCELVSFGLIGTLVLKNHSRRDIQGSSEENQDEVPRNALATAFISEIGVVVFLLALYPIRLSLWPLLSRAALGLGSFQVPATFDPAPLVYPTLLPALIAALVSNTTATVIIVNTTLGLSTLPSQLIPTWDSNEDYNATHWFLTLAPVLSIRHLYANSLFHEIHAVYIFLFPLHRTLLAILQNLTTTSLLSSEVQLLSVGLINVLLFSTSPQSTILMVLLWVGGLGLLLLCGPILRWNVSLERIPNWRFRHADQIKKMNTSLFSKFIERLRPREHFTIDSDDANLPKQPRITSALGAKATPNGTYPMTPFAADSQPTTNLRVITDKISNINNATVGQVHDTTSDTRKIPAVLGLPEQPIPATNTKSRKRTLSMSAQAYLSLTTFEVEIRKWSYAAYAYVITIFLIFVPIRTLIAADSLRGRDPFVWAIGYLFGNITFIWDFVLKQQLGDWINLPPAVAQPLKNATATFIPMPHLVATYGESNTRLILFGYWALIVALGITSVLQLSSVADVDTRRKVFHGMMVIMLLPTTYIDPCFLSLGLILVLAVFLLLELFRAAQLRPLSKPLARFLTPYVDGRDLRGPVVISHIFLLIGCAIPFWLSLADTLRTGDGWDVATRDVSMIAGVVCVGMGDAAASLVGRRFGRRKWPWAGGKSLEGSAAFAAAVTVGLLAGKVWLVMGGWERPWGSVDNAWLHDFGKACLAAIGASFTEAVLTGANDNVVVPIVLWLLVKGLEL